jgi:LemA protein
MSGRIGIVALLFLAMVIGVVGVFTVVHYNGIVNRSQNVEEAISQIEVACQRRLDLIPNLVEMVKGYARHEQDTLFKITAARAQAAEALQGIRDKSAVTQAELLAIDATQSKLAGTMRNLLVAVENYPNLKASHNFLALQDQFEGTENRIAVARHRYNQAVRDYNAKIERFPGNVYAPFFGFSERPYFETSQEALTPISVQF